MLNFTFSAFKMFAEIEKSQLSIPFKCPLNCCIEDLCSSTLLIHLIKSHQIEVKEIEENVKVTSALNVNSMKIGENYCIGVLALKSEKFKSKNELLPYEYRHLENHLPILIMTACDNYGKLYGIDEEIFNHEGKFLSFWLASPSRQNHKLFSSITLHDHQMKKSLSQLVEVRKVENSQNIIDFMNKETDHLTSNIHLLETISSNFKIYIETSVVDLSSEM